MSHVLVRTSDDVLLRVFSVFPVLEQSVDADTWHVVRTPVPEGGATALEVGDGMSVDATRVLVEPGVFACLTLAQFEWQVSSFGRLTGVLVQARDDGAADFLKHMTALIPST